MSDHKINGSPREPTEPQARDKPTPAAVDVLSHAGASGYNHWTCVRRRLDLRVPEAKLGYVDRQKADQRLDFVPITREVTTWPMMM